MKKVITYGTFDLFHEGHYNILKRAKEYGDYLIVGVTGENYDVGRGKLFVHDTLAERIENVQNTGLVDKVIVEEYLGQKITDITKYNVDTFVIGDDWKGKFDHLSRYCNMVYLERTKGVSSTQLRAKSFTGSTIGMYTDILDDNQIIEEAPLAKRFEISGVYSDEDAIKSRLKQQYNLPKAFDSYQEMLDECDIAYIHCDQDKRPMLVEKALLAGKHVICDSPFSCTLAEQEKLLALAKEKEVILFDNIKMVHIFVFNQLLWMTQGGLIGDILSFHCSISRNDRNRSNIFYDLLVLALCPMLKIMGQDYSKLDINVTKENGQIEFASLVFKYDNKTAVLNVGNKVRVKNQLEIIGTDGTIHAGENWWRGKYFELSKPDEDESQIYNTNFEGNGFKYLLKVMADMLEDGRLESRGIFEDESLKMAEIVEAVRKH